MQEPCCSLRGDQKPLKPDASIFLKDVTFGDEFALVTDRGQVDFGHGLHLEVVKIFELLVRHARLGDEDDCAARTSRADLGVFSFVGQVDVRLVAALDVHDRHLILRLDH